MKKVSTMAVVEALFKKGLRGWDDRDVAKIRRYLNGQQRCMDWDALDSDTQMYLKEITRSQNDMSVLI